jgi:hypothetical protein
VIAVAALSSSDHARKFESALLAAARRVLEASAGHADPAAMADLLGITSSMKLAHLENWERKLRFEFWEVDRNIRSQWTLWRKPVRPISWLDLCSGDGFRRERALREVSSPAPNGFFLSLALRRLNDWVPEVRAAAGEQLPRIVQASSPEDVTDALWATLPHFISWGRLLDAERQVLVTLVALERLSAHLKTRVLTSNSGPTAAVLAQLGRTPIIDPWLDEIAREAIQPSVRAMAFRCLLEKLVTWVVGRRWVWTDLKWCKGRFDAVFAERPLTIEAPAAETLRRAVTDRSAIVRRVGGDFLVGNLAAIGADSRDMAQRLASDPAPSVAERGCWALARLDSRNEAVE